MRIRPGLWLAKQFDHFFTKKKWMNRSLKERDIVQPSPHDAMSAGQLARCDFVTSKLPLEKRGIEIAPYFNPIVDHTRNNVLYVDCIDNDEIQRKAADNPGAEGRVIPRVDAVWKPGRPLAKCIGREPLSYAIASHVLEHVPNPLGWIQEIIECLEPGGILAILLPNRERTMDFYRRPTTFADVMGWSIEKSSRPTPTQVMDFLSQSFEDDGTQNFMAMPPFSAAKRHYTDTDAIGFAEFVAKKDHYLDVHCSVWTPNSFIDVFSRIINAGKLHVELDGPYFPSDSPIEFVTYLHKQDDGAKKRINAKVASHKTAKQSYNETTSVVLHIGAIKTGSSALQYDMTWNPIRKNLVPSEPDYEYASLVPGQLIRGSQLQSHAKTFAAHYSMSATLSALTSQQPAFLDRARESLAAVHRDGRIPVLSYETWLRATPKDIERFTNTLGGKIRAIVYVRPPVQWLASWYYQRDKVAEDPRFVERYLRFARFIDAIKVWQAAPFVERVDIRLHSKNICTDFCHVLGCTKSSKSIQHNQSLPDAAVDLLVRRSWPEKLSISEAKFALWRWLPEKPAVDSILTKAAFPFNQKEISHIISATQDASRELLQHCDQDIRTLIESDQRWWSDAPEVHGISTAKDSESDAAQVDADTFTLILWECLLEADAAWRRERSS